LIAVTINEVRCTLHGSSSLPFLLVKFIDQPAPAHFSFMVSPNPVQGDGEGRKNNEDCRLWRPTAQAKGIESDTKYDTKAQNRT
jgi:hypothetical protein